MSFADVVADARKPDPKRDRNYRNTDEPQLEMPPLEGQVTNDGIKLDTTDMDALGERIKAVRLELASLKKEEERLRKLILVHPDARVGFSNAHIEIAGEERLVSDDPKMLAFLEENDLLGGVSELKVSVRKLRRLGTEMRDSADEPSELRGTLSSTREGS